VSGGDEASLVAAATEETSTGDAVDSSEPVDSPNEGEVSAELAGTTGSENEDEASGEETEETETEEPEESGITETGIYDDEFVYVGDEEDLALDSVLQEIRRPYDSSAVGLRRDEPAAFDSIPKRLPSGEYRINEYKAKLTTDYIGGGFSYDTFFGVRGQTIFGFSDHLGNHQVFLATDLVNSLDQSFVQAYYFNNKNRISLGAGAFHTKNYYEDTYNFLFSDRFYGVQGFASRPFSTFSRLELSLSQVFIDRKYYDRPFDTRENRSSEITSLAGSYVFDNVLWGYTGPVNGRRFKLTIDGGTNIFDSGDIDFYSVGADYRRYWHIDGAFSAAFRLSGGASFGGAPKQYFLGGTTNWIGTRTLDAKVYDVENLYFADVVTPLRGEEYYGISGDRYALMNWELRFPLVQYFVMRFPLPIVIANVQGAAFMDMGAAWFGSDFKGGSSVGGDHLEDIKTGFGFGMRINLFGFALLRYDLAWSTDWRDVSDKPKSYFSFGADF
jgi:outer membrane protein assembly factor BamA